MFIIIIIFIKTKTTQKISVRTMSTGCVCTNCAAFWPFSQTAASSQSIACQSMLSRIAFLTRISSSTSSILYMMDSPDHSVSGHGRFPDSVRKQTGPPESICCLPVSGSFRFHICSVAEQLPGFLFQDLGQLHLFPVRAFQRKIPDALLPVGKKADLVVQAFHAAGQCKAVRFFNVVYVQGDMFDRAGTLCSFFVFIDLQHQISLLQKGYRSAVVGILRRVYRIKSKLRIEQKGSSQVFCRDSDMLKTCHVI